ncbi:TadE/TadG family type IV pilus assembly protein [Paraburkholderia phosphatilytica]|uniref:TadE/TadG family type IV pilus assembly protein n=1 Tax=Paraburkholderia phosphatilytica TaxID=2282883 RepID=UPI000E4D4757|nr:TadE/TadG family type IV pilus assembly protein [Paraburkholderia phosphatilytica]
MNTTLIRQRRYRRRERGVAAVEFALVAPMFFMLLIGIMEMGRVLFYWNSAAEATRFGARVAVVCDVNASQSSTNPVVKDMQRILPVLQPSNVTVAYSPSGCDATSCVSVTVSVANINVNTLVPFVPFSVVLPSFSTTLPRESLSSQGGTNPTCS